jgi:hypothetical protein
MTLKDGGQEFFWGDGTFLYPNCGEVYTNVYIG